MAEEILKVSHLSVAFTQYDHGFKRREISAVKDLNLEIHRGEIVAVVGSSGSGKSLLAHAVMGILPYNASMKGEIRFCGEVMTRERLKAIRGRKMALIPQSVSYLDPLMKIGAQVTNGNREPSMMEKCKNILKRYGLEETIINKFPFQLSGGMTRRVLISTAVMEEPELVIADEPTPGLHKEAALEIMGHFKELAAGGAGILLITHDLELAIMTADRILVLYGGQTIEEAEAAFFHEDSLKHPYTKALCRSMPGKWRTDGDRLCDSRDILDYMREEYGQ